MNRGLFSRCDIRAHAAAGFFPGADSGLDARSPMRAVRFVGTVVVALALAGFALGGDTWWPAQKLPRAVVRVRVQADTTDEMRRELEFLAQSLSGLAAHAVNAGKGEELVWIESDNPSVERWGARFGSEHPAVEQRGHVELWDLVEQYRKAGLVQGYVLYRADDSVEQPGQKYRPGMDVSVNVATSLVSLLGAVLIGERMEEDARRRGLACLLDARDKTQQWCFDTYRDHFRRDLLCTQDPRKPHARDYAIAQGAFTVYGPEPVVEQAMQWLEPLSPILGWNGGDEFRTTRLATVHGHFQTCTDWVQNLPLLMAGAMMASPRRLPRFDPRTINWDDPRSTVSFLCSDGDNVQWFETNFFDSQGHYWDNPRRGELPFGWTAPLTHLTQLVPQAVDYAIETATTNDAFVEWHSGYFYPDLFAHERADRWELLAEHTRRSWAMMQRAGVDIIGYNFRHLDQPDAKTALEVIAKQTDGLLAILAFQYSPYNAGAGEVWWVRDRTGAEVPVITLRYQLWWNLNRRANAGTPMKIAREISTAVAQAVAEGRPRHDWALVHAWSYFQDAGDSTDENAENLPPLRELPAGQTHESLGGVRGYDPVRWCAARLPDSVRAVSIAETAWRLRMQRDPAKTRALLGR